MEIIKFYVIIIISFIIFRPIDKKFKFRSKYHNHSNRGFRLLIIIIGLLSMVMEIVIALSTDNLLKSFRVSRDMVSFIFEVPMLFVLLVGMPQFSENK